ncbi:hypothetical protein Tco_0058500 [Tanacetum coccineum]
MNDGRSSRGPTLKEQSGLNRVHLCPSFGLLEYQTIRPNTKYEALTSKMKVEVLNVCVNSKLEASRIKGEFVACNNKAKEYISRFTKFRIRNTPRQQNTKDTKAVPSITIDHLRKESLGGGLQLAHNAQGRKGGDLKVRLLPNTCSGSKSDKNLHDFSNGTMAFLPMRNGHRRTVAGSPREG